MTVVFTEEEVHALLLERCDKIETFGPGHFKVAYRASYEREYKVEFVPQGSPDPEPEILAPIEPPSFAAVTAEEFGI